MPDSWSTRADRIEELVHYTAHPRRWEIGGAPERLAETVGTSVDPIRATLATAQGLRGIALVTTSGLYFAPADNASGVWSFPVARIAQVSPPNHDAVRVDAADGGHLVLTEFASEAECARFGALLGALIVDGPAAAHRRNDEIDRVDGSDGRPAGAVETRPSRAPSGVFAAVASVVAVISLLWLFGLSSVVMHDTEAEAQAAECQGQVGLDCAPPVIDPTNGTYRYDCGTIGGTFSRQDNNTGTII
jgi:hypothetical protein